MSGKKYQKKWDVRDMDLGRVMDFVRLTDPGEEENVIPRGRVRSIHPGGDMELVIRNGDEIL
jgi:hypothetical protein